MLGFNLLPAWVQLIFWLECAAAAAYYTWKFW
jgi:hypothetical protein